MSSDIMGSIAERHDEKSQRMINAKIKASVKWLVMCIYGDAGVPDVLISDLFNQQNKTPIQSMPHVVRCLTNGSFYCQASSKILHDNSLATSDVSIVISALSRRGFDFGESLETHISVEQLASPSPFNTTAHVLLIDTLMAAHLKSSISIDQVVKAISTYTPIEKREEPLDPVDALLFWINKICSIVRDRVENDEVNLKTNNSLDTTIPEMEDLYEDLGDGTCLCTLISFYHPVGLPIQDIIFNDPMSVEDSLHNIRIVRNFCANYFSWNPFHFEPEDILHINENEALHKNVNAFLADLFYFFESTPKPPKNNRAEVSPPQRTFLPVNPIPNLRCSATDKPSYDLLKPGAAKIRHPREDSVMSTDSLLTTRSKDSLFFDAKLHHVPNNLSNFETVLHKIGDHNLQSGGPSFGSKNPLEIRLQMEELRRKYELNQKMMSSQQEQRKMEENKNAFFRVMSNSLNEGVTTAIGKEVEQNNHITRSNDDSTNSALLNKEMESMDIAGATDATGISVPLNNHSQYSNHQSSLYHQRNPSSQDPNQPQENSNPQLQYVSPPTNIGAQNFPFAYQNPGFLAQQPYNSGFVPGFNSYISQHKLFQMQQQMNGQFFPLINSASSNAQYFPPVGASGCPNNNFPSIHASADHQAFTSTPIRTHNMGFQQHQQQKPLFSNNIRISPITPHYFMTAGESQLQMDPKFYPSHKQIIEQQQKQCTSFPVVMNNNNNNNPYPLGGIALPSEISSFHGSFPISISQSNPLSKEFSTSPPPINKQPSFRLHYEKIQNDNVSDPSLQFDSVDHMGTFIHATDPVTLLNSKEFEIDNGIYIGNGGKQQKQLRSDIIISPIDSNSKSSPEYGSLSSASGGELKRSPEDTQASRPGGGVVLIDPDTTKPEMTEEMEAKRRALIACQMRRKERINSKAEKDCDINLEKVQKQEIAEQKKQEKELKRQKVLENYRRRKMTQDLNGPSCSSRIVGSSMNSLNMDIVGSRNAIGRPKSQSNIHLLSSSTMTLRNQRTKSNLNNNADRVSTPSLAEPSLPLYVRHQPKSNRALIMNALQYSIFPGFVSSGQLLKAQTSVNHSDSKHFLILFRDHRCQYRGIYTWDQFSNTVHRIDGNGPQTCNESMMTLMFKYDSGSKSFGTIPTKNLSPTIDGFAIQEHFWQKSRTPQSCR